MARFKQVKQYKKNDNNHRWLVSYADYMTLMFAFFVVMYAMSSSNNKELSVISETLSKVFITRSNLDHYQPEPLAQDQLSNISNYDSSVEFERLDHAEPIDMTQPMSEVKTNRTGQSLESLQEALKRVLSDEIAQGYAEIEHDMDWVTIELSSSLMFTTGSALLTKRARDVLQTLIPLLNSNRNYIRTRGYTDDLPINNELFRSNWHLSVARATEVLILLESLGIAPTRMATEGYGQYAPFSDNSDELGRQQNRKVVIAISKYALPEITIKKPIVQQQQNESEKQQSTSVKKNNELKVIELKNGGILITTREQE